MQITFHFEINAKQMNESTSERVINHSQVILPKIVIKIKVTRHVRDFKNVFYHHKNKCTYVSRTCLIKIMTAAMGNGQMRCR